MNISDILALIKAGYTKAEIDAMETNNLADQNNVHDETVDSKNLVNQTSTSDPPSNEDKPIEIPSIPKVEVKDADEPRNTNLENKLDTLINLIQRQAIINSNMPDVPSLTLEDVAASIIDPNSTRRNELNGK